MSKQPMIYMIGGPNGAGKTTVALEIMPRILDCYEYVNADSIAYALSPFKQEKVAIEAGRIMLKRIREIAVKQETFAFETTMASRSFVHFLSKCKSNGYAIHLIFIWLQSPDLSIARVAKRVEAGDTRYQLMSFAKDIFEALIISSNYTFQWLIAGRFMIIQNRLRYLLQRKFWVII